MARIPRNQNLMLSPLDRLLDRDPTAPGRGGEQTLRDLKQAVRRDLENLLNTRWRCKMWPPGLDELETSLVNYGIPDFTGTNLGTPSAREEFRRIIERVIQRFEPRFKTVRVVFVDSADPIDRTLRFRIDAMLRADPAPPEPVVFDTALEPSTAGFVVKRAGR